MKNWREMLKHGVFKQERVRRIAEATLPDTEGYTFVEGEELTVQWNDSGEHVFHGTIIAVERDPVSGACKLTLEEIA